MLSIIAAAILMLLPQAAHLMGQAAMGQAAMCKAAVVTYPSLAILNALAMVVAPTITASGGLQSITKVLASALLLLIQAASLSKQQ